MLIKEMLNKNLDNYAKILGLLSVIFIIIGYFIFFSYTISFRYFPQGFTASDNFTVIIFSVTFLVLYVIIVGCYLSLSIMMWPIWSLLYVPFVLINLIRKKKKKKIIFNQLPFYRGHLYLIPEMLLGLILALKFISIDLKNISYTILTLYFMSLIISYLKHQIVKIDSFKDLFKLKVRDDYKKNRSVKENLTGVILIVLIPLLLLGQTFFIIERSMELLGIKANSVEINIQIDYEDFLDENFQEYKVISTNEKYIKLSNINVQLQGLGNFTVISIEKDDKRIIQPIPNEYIIPIKRTLVY